jgi:ribosome biogenesis GTPase
MRPISRKLEKLGVDQFFLDHVAPERLETFEIARVVAVHKDSYVVSDGEKDVVAELVGKLIYGAASPLDYPTVGDWVRVNFFDNQTFAVIHEVLPRKSLLKRKTQKDPRQKN